MAIGHSIFGKYCSMIITTKLINKVPQHYSIGTTNCRKPIRVFSWAPAALAPCRPAKSINHQHWHQTPYQLVRPQAIAALCIMTLHLTPQALSRLVVLHLAQFCMIHVLHSSACFVRTIFYFFEHIISGESEDFIPDQYQSPTSTLLTSISCELGVMLGIEAYHLELRLLQLFFMCILQNLA